MARLSSWLPRFGGGARPIAPSTRAAAVTLAAAVFGAGACGSDKGSERSGAARPSVAGEADGDEAPDLMDAVRNGDVSALLALLWRSHASVRSGIGPHVLEWTATHDLRGTSARTELPSIDTPVVDDRKIEDHGSLTWSSAADAPPAWRLSQSNEHERGRDVIALGEVMFVQQRHRAWVEQPYEPRIVELWLDDAYHAVHDAIELAAPRLKWDATTASGAGLHGGDVVTLTVSLSDAEAALDDTRPSAQGVRRAWRQEAELRHVAGTLTLDATSGVWLVADLQVQYALVAADERTMLGTLDLAASLSAGPPEPVTAPATSVALPQRTRYHTERQTLLEGL